MSNWWGEYGGPRRPAQGIRAQSQRGQFGKSWWAQRWIAALEWLVDAGRLSRGRSYARSGQVTQLDVGKGSIDARVQGSHPTPYKVTIRVSQLPDAAWERVCEAMAAEAIYAAKLLAGEMPKEIEQAFEATGSALFPQSAQDWTSSCSCPDWANPCKHVAAVCYLLGERFDADPFLMFLLRGRSGEEVATALRALRGASGAEPLEEAQEAVEPELPLPVDPAAFWSPPAGVTALALGFEPPALDALPVKRLGPPAFAPDPAAFAVAMERMYQTISAYARTAALGEDDEQAEGEPVRGTGPIE